MIGRSAGRRGACGWISACHNARPLHLPGLPDTRRRPILIVGLAIFAVQVLRTAWVCDDSYITFRTADNIVNGFGPVWNISERVQGFTHPLWLAMFTTVYAVTREAYYTSIALGALLSLGAVLFVGLAVARTRWSLVVTIVALLSSKAFIDFSTSGIENPLSHVLVVAFLWTWWQERPAIDRLRRLSLIGALLMLTRIDLALLIAPALMAEAWTIGPIIALRPLTAGFAPLIAWEMFSAFYYGSLVPNTAYAKLNVTMAPAETIARGLAYFDRTLWADPATLPAILFGIALVLWARPRRDWPLVAGLVATLVYVVWIGGDFMAGRFFTVPLIWSATLIASVGMPPRAGVVMASSLLIIGLLAPWEPAIISGIGYARIDNLLRGRAGRGPSDDGLNITIHEITDVRRYYYEGTGLAKGQFRFRRPDDPGVDDGLRLREGGRQVVVRDSIGFVGYFAGPEPHIVDMFALTDPLLARLPALRGSRVGHYQRDIPAGYLESIEAKANHIADPSLSAYYDTLRLVVSGPLFDVRRVTAALLLAAGRSDKNLQQYVARMSDR